MHILLIHQCYRQQGGEERIVLQQQRWLTQAGHQVSLWLEPALPPLPTARWLRLWQHLRLTFRICWSRRSARMLRQRVLAAQQNGQAIDVIHIHNTFPGISLSIVHQAKQLQLPIVMTLHNARWLTPSAVTQPDGTLISSRQAWLDKTYRNSRLATSVVLLNNLLHRSRQSLERCDAIICPSQFLAAVYQRHWPRPLPLRVIAHGSDFVTPVVTPSPLTGTSAPAHKASHEATPRVFPKHSRRGALFAGRADAEKGLPWLLAHWPYAIMPLTVVAPVSAALKAAYPQAHFCQWLAPEALAACMASMELVVVPSLVGESFGNTALEALALAVPVLAARSGALPELVQHGHNGLLFQTMDAVDLQAKVRMFVDSPALQSQLRQHAARSVQHLSAQHHVQALTQLYHELVVKPCQMD
jgi:glycosyltransferase involved in cell wall biosynthesis